MNFTLKDETADTAVDKVCDQMNLIELWDLDREIYFSKKAELATKWNEIHRELSGSD